MGIDWVKVVSSPILVEALLKEELQSSFGAQVLFAGIVRAQNLGRTVRAVSYDAFLPLAEKTFWDLIGEVKVLQPECQIGIVHRTGRLEVGEISLAILVRTPHREEAYSISRQLLEKIKVRAPIWKKEHYADGDSDWLQGHALCGPPAPGGL